MCPLSELRTFNGFTFSNDGWHPFVATTDEYLNAGHRGYTGSILEQFYQKWQPKDALEALIGASHGPKVLREFPAYTSHLPWLEIRPEEREAVMAKNIRDENRCAGNIKLDASSGYGLHGPVSPEKAEIEYRRIVRIAESISKHGFDRAKAGEDVTVTAVERGGEYRFCISHGQHRVAVLAALGHEEVPVSLIRVVSLNEVNHWPQVYRGVWSKAEAEAYIDHLFEFDAHQWAAARGLV
ncbi:hypothetical protein [Marinimicrobium sp. ABcell2]|uniref:hypothetical protein n=1 Tax=Marinimicrobium sp. ABcell2 TaxID=3069751 RepID=UPI0027B6EDB6|nr:hypothetical protein [Marinimicrobium sp. ABcell2]MDQ2076182.1 hypothetical protein [Marinimicrobium sp. ABcell2]